MMGVEEQVGRLEVVLQAEENLYLRLRDVLRREESELIELEPAKIAVTVEQKLSLAEEARLLEDTRRALTAALGRALQTEDGIQVPIGPWPVRAARAEGAAPTSILIRISAQHYNELADYDHLASVLERRLVEASVSGSQVRTAWPDGGSAGPD